MSLAENSNGREQLNDLENCSVESQIPFVSAHKNQGSVSVKNSASKIPTVDGYPDFPNLTPEDPYSF